MVDGDVLPPIVPPKDRNKGPAEPEKCTSCGKRYLTLDDVKGQIFFGKDLTDIQKLSSEKFQRATAHVVSKKDGKTYHWICLMNQAGNGLVKVVNKIIKSRK